MDYPEYEDFLGPLAQWVSLEKTATTASQDLQEKRASKETRVARVQWVLLAPKAYAEPQEHQDLRERGDHQELWDMPAEKEKTDPLVLLGLQVLPDYKDSPDRQVTLARRATEVDEAFQVLLDPRERQEILEPKEGQDYPARVDQMDSRA